MSEDGGQRTEDGRRDRFDLAIDRAVRDLLDVEQPAGFSRRVMARIGNSAIDNPTIDNPTIDNPTIDNPTSVVSGFSRKVFWVGAPLAAAAVVILALLVPREQVHPQPETPVTVATVQPPSSEPAPEAGSRKPGTGSREPEAGGRELRKPRPSQLRVPDRIVAAATTAVPDTTIEIEPLRRIVPIEFAPLSQRAIAPADIAVPPLTPVTELQIAPLNPPDRRN